MTKKAYHRQFIRDCGGKDGGGGNSTQLNLYTNVPVDDQFSSPKQIRCCPPGSPLVGKLLVGNGTIEHVRNADLSFFSKSGGWSNAAAVDSDANYAYTSYNSLAKIQKSSLSDVYTLVALTAALGNGGIRMIDASGDPDHIYVTSNNATDGHGFRMITKSTMAVTNVGGNDVKILATGSGNNQFNNPLGLKFVSTGIGTGKLYICDVSNSRVVILDVVTTSGSESITWNSAIDTISTLGAIYDMDTDGVNWYVQTNAARLQKTDLNFNSIIHTGLNNGYSCCLIPDQGDGNGQTIAITDNTNSHLARYKCSDLSLINEVGTSGDGSSSLFDPTFTTSTATTVTYQFDDGFSYTTPSGTSHALSWNGFAGYSFRSAGPHKCTVRVNGGLGLVTGIDCNTDAITVIKNLNKCRSGGNYLLNANSELKLDLSVFAGKSFITFWAHSGNSLTGAISNLKSYSDLRLSGNNIYGSLSDLFASATLVWINYMSGFVPASIAHLVAIRDLRIYNMGWTAQQNTDVILSAWNARANYTYASNIALRISAPTGTPGTEPPVEAGPGHDTSDWAWNAVTSRYDPLTGYAAIADLQNDFYGEGFKIWIITIQ